MAMHLPANVNVRLDSISIRYVQYPNDIEWLQLVNVDTKSKTNYYDSVDQSNHLRGGRYFINSNLAIKETVKTYRMQ